jgi:hypothetical protein
MPICIMPLVLNSLRSVLVRLKSGTIRPFGEVLPQASIGWAEVATGSTAPIASASRTAPTHFLLTAIAPIYKPSGSELSAV